MKKQVTSSVAILILSCDKYQDLWEPFFYQFRKSWPDCPYQLYLGSNTKKYNDANIQTILSGPDKNWSESLLSILKQIPEEYLFVWLDDIFIISKTSDDVWDACWKLLQKNANHIHMSQLPQADSIYSDRMFGVYKKGAPYRVNVLGFWRKSCLIRMIIPGENPWQFEIMGSYRSSFDDGFYCLMEPLFLSLHVVEKGKLFKTAIQYCKEHAIPLDTSKRQMIQGSGYLISEIKIIVFYLMNKIPWEYRVRLMASIRRLVSSY